MNTVTLPRAALEQALKLLDALSYNENYDYDGCFQHWADYARPEKLALQFRAALEQSQDHVPDAGKMVPTGWKLVPVEPTNEMVQAWLDTYEGNIQTVYRAMLAAAPQPPVVEQPQVEQEPVAWMTEDGRVASDELKQTAMASSSRTNFNIPLYTHPHPTRQPLTDQVIQELADEGVFHANVFEIVRRIEEEHGIFKLRAQGIGGGA